MPITKPQISKREAQRLAKAAESDPLPVLQIIGEKEKHAAISLSLWLYSTGKADWSCSIAFAGAALAARGEGGAPGEAVKIAILRAYDTGNQRGWQSAKRPTGSEG